MIQCDASRLVLPRAFSPRTQFRGEGQDSVLPWAPAFAGVAKFLNSSTAASAWIWWLAGPRVAPTRTAERPSSTSSRPPIAQLLGFRRNSTHLERRGRPRRRLRATLSRWHDRCTAIGFGQCGRSARHRRRRNLQRREFLKNTAAIAGAAAV